MRSAMPRFDSIQGYEQAKDERFWEGMELGVCEYRSGSVYLLGYHIEIALKSALALIIVSANSRPHALLPRAPRRMVELEVAETMIKAG